MGTTQTTRAYEKSEFTGTTPPGNPNVSIFAQEVSDESLSVQPSSVYSSGTDIVLMWDSGLPVTSDITLIDGVVASHEGGDFASSVQQEVVEAEDDDDTGDPVVRATLDTGLLPADDYLLSWYAEGKVDSVVASTGMRIRLYITKNGGSRDERGEFNNDLNGYNPFSGTVMLNAVKAGETYKFELEYEKLGPTSNPAYIQRCRIFLAPR